MNAGSLVLTSVSETTAYRMDRLTPSESSSVKSLTDMPKDVSLR